MEAAENGEYGAPPGCDDRYMQLDREACYRALQARDRRFDGRFFTAVRTTGIYCRPICPARTPRLENVVFYPSATAAQEAGLRPCLRCRPETSPEIAAWRGTANTVTRALSLMDQGALDGGRARVSDLALRLGIGERQLRRLFEEHLGASPVAVAQTRRFLFAKRLIHETHMSMTEVAMASGFGSLRRFNDVFRRRHGRPPSTLRRRAAAGDDTGDSGITLLLGHTGPYDWPAVVDFLAARAIPGVERVEPGRYSRTVEVHGQVGTIEVSPAPRQAALAATIRVPAVDALAAIVARVRCVFDLSADARAIAAHLSRDATLAPLVAERPGLRVPGAWDGFEMAVRAVLGQQVTVKAARLLCGRLAERYGEPLRAAQAAAAGLSRVFPRPERLAVADLAGLGLPRARARTLAALASAAVSDPRLFEPGRDLETSVARLRALPGIGEWTAQYVALRALREPDAFPAADVGLQRATTAPDGRRPSPHELRARAEAWRPWRGYAAQHLWTADASRTAVSPPSREQVA